MIVLVKLILAHLIGDYLLQFKTWVADKEAKKIRSPKLYLHVLLHGLVSWIVLWDWKYWSLVLILMVSHLLIDLAKLYFQKDKNRPAWFIADQLMHLAVIVALWYFYFVAADQPFPLSLPPELLVYGTAAYFLSFPMALVMQIILKPWSELIPQQTDESLANAGKYIGIIERILVFLFVVTANWEAVGFLIAAKSIFRFGDISESKNRKLTEYIMIGTLLSFGIAMMTGVLATTALKMVD